jgi:hypothetical protein
MPCDSCPEVVCVNVIGIDRFMSLPYRMLVRPPLMFLIPVLQILGLMGNPYSKAFYERLSERYSPCQCGGTFRHDAPHHCPRCRAPLPRNLVKGVYITRFVEV